MGNNFHCMISYVGWHLWLSKIFTNMTEYHWLHDYIFRGSMYSHRTDCQREITFNICHRLTPCDLSTHPLTERERAVGEMGQPLSVLSAPPEDPDSVPETHLAAYNCIKSQLHAIWHPLVACKGRCTCAAHKLMQVHTRTHKWALLFKK